MRMRTEAGVLDDCGSESGAASLSRAELEALLRGERDARRRLEEALAAARRENAAKSGFLACLSHEIRTPMNAILGITRLTLDENCAPPEMEKRLRCIEESGRHLLDMLGDALDMCRAESGKLTLSREWSTLSAILMPAIDMLRPAMEEKHITLHYPAELERSAPFECFLDPIKTRQIFINLIGNACKYTGEGGNIELSIRSLLSGPEEAVDEICVRDDGCGMSGEFLQKAFEPFAQEPNRCAGAARGTGLGLPLARTIARAMGGDISAESAPGLGSNFRVLLPYARRAAAGRTGGDSARAARPLLGARILMAEDHPFSAAIAKKLLERRGAAVTLAENGRETLRLFEASAPGEYRAILMDLRMPVMDGLEATRAIRALGRADARRIPIFAATANSFEEEKRAAAEAGVDRFLIKPIDPDQLCEAISEIEKGKRL